MIQFCITAKQLRKALKVIEKAEANNFNHCLAVFELTKVGNNLEKVRANYYDLLERAHASDPKLNWGCGQHITDDYVFDGKTIIEIDELGTISDYQ